MSTTVGELVVEVRAKVDRLAGDMDKAKGSVNRSMNDIKGAASAVTGYLSAIGVGAFAGYIKSAIDAGGALFDLSKKTGISTKDLSSLEYAAKMSGTTLEGVAGGLKKLASNMVATSQGASSNAEAFKALGISVTDTGGNLRSTQSVMLSVADRFAGMQDGAEKSALAVKLFGKSGTDLIPLLNEGSKGIEKMQGTASALGLTLTDEAAAGMESLGDSMDTIGMAGQGIARQFAAELTPAISAIAGSFLGAATEGGALAGAVALLSKAFKSLVSVAVGVVAVFDVLARATLTTFSIIGNAIKGDFTQARNDFQFLTEDMSTIFSEAGAKINAVWASQEAAQKPVTEGLREHETQTRNVTAAVGENASKLQGVIKALDDEREMLGLTAEQSEIYKQQTAAGVAANSEAGRLIAEKVTQLFAERQAVDEATAAAEAAATASKEHQQAIAEQTNTLRERVDTLSEEMEVAGMTGQQIEELALVRLREREAQLDAIIASSGMTAERQAEKEAIAEQIRLQTDLVSLVGRKEIAEAQTEQAAAAKEAWTETARSIENALTDSLMRGFESGKGMVQSLKDYIVNAFKTTVVKFVVQAIMGGVGGMIPGMASASTGAGGAMGTLSNLGSLFSAGKSLFSGGFSSMLSGPGGALGDSLSSLRFGLGDIASKLGFDKMAAGFNSQALEIKSFGANIMDIGANMGAGFLGSLAGNKLGQAIFGERQTTGIGGTIGGVLGSAGGPIGTMIGSFLGSLAENAIGKILGLGDQAKWGKLGITTGSDVPTDGSALQTMTGASGLQLTAVAKRTDEAAALQLLEGFAAIDQSLTTFARAAGVTVDFSKKVLGNTNLNVENQGPNNSFGVGDRLDKFSADKIKTSADDFARAWVSEIDDQLSSRIKSIMGDTSRRTAGQIVELFGFATTIDKLLSVNVVQEAAKAREAAESQSRSLDVYSEASNKVRQLSEDFDGSTQSMTALSEALTAQKVIAAQIAQAYEELAVAINASFLSAIDEIRQSLMSPEETISANKSRIDAAVAELRAAADPETIANLSAEIQSLVKATFGMLDKDQQKVQGQQFIDLLTESNAIAAARLEESKAALAANEEALKNSVDQSLAAFAASVESLASSQAAQSAEAADRTAIAIAGLNGSVQAGTASVVGAISGLRESIASAVNSAATSSSSAIASLTSRLDAIESSARLQRAGPNG
jgi:hypothetical protein